MFIIKFICLSVVVHLDSHSIPIAVFVSRLNGILNVLLKGHWLCLF